MPRFSSWVSKTRSFSSAPLFTRYLFPLWLVAFLSLSMAGCVGMPDPSKELAPDGIAEQEGSRESSQGDASDSEGASPEAPPQESVVEQFIPPERPPVEADSRCPRCLWDGQCTFSSERRACIAATAEDCLQSYVCISQGKCSPKEGTCQILSDEDCQKSNSCASIGSCGVLGDRCAPTRQEHCQQSEMCKNQAFCTLQRGGGACVVGGDADCAQSAQCKERGACAFYGQSCTPSQDSHCANSEICKREGFCSYVKKEGAFVGTCSAEKDSDCASSEICKKSGYCGAYGGRCYPLGNTTRDCAGHTACKEKAYCTPKEGKCVIGGDADCRLSDECQLRAKCYLSSWGECHSRSQQDCDESPPCQERGDCCIRGHGVCVCR